MNTPHALTITRSGRKGLMKSRVLSLGAVALATVGMVYLLLTKHLFAVGPVGITVQVLVAALMFWSRITFGSSSFHAAADPTPGGLVTRGPYHFWRHPIDASIIYFTWA